MHFIREALPMHKLTLPVRQILISFLCANKYQTEARNEHAKLTPSSSEVSALAKTGR